MRKLKMAAMTMLVLAFAVQAGGCLALAAAGAAGASVAYVEGNSEGLVHASPDQVIAATLNTFKDMGITVTSQKKEEDEQKWRIKGESQAGDDVKVTLEQKASGLVKLWVRVGFFGDEQFSRTIYTHIQQQLPQDQTAQPAASDKSAPETSAP